MVEMFSVPIRKKEEYVATMKAVRIHDYGSPEVLVYEDAPKPEPAAGELLIRVHAAGRQSHRL